MDSAVGVSNELGAASAVAEAAAAAVAALGGVAPAAALVAVATACGPLDEASVRAARDALGADCRIAGFQAEGILAEGVEATGEPAAAVLALGATEVEVCILDHVRGHEVEIGEQLQAELGPLTERDLLFLACDAHAFDPRELARGLGHCAPASLLGIGVEGAAGARATCFADGEIADDGALAVRIRGTSAAALRRAAGVRLLDERSVTRARGHWCLSIDGEPAFDAFRAAAGALADDPKRAARSVLAFVDSGDPADPECARWVVGFDEDAGAIGLSQAVGTGERIRFAVRDGFAAREALAAAAAGLSAHMSADAGAEAGAGPPGIGLATTCRTRGAALFGEAGLESGYLSLGFGGCPWLGVVGSFQLVAAPSLPPQLLNLSGTLARIR